MLLESSPVPAFAPLAPSFAAVNPPVNSPSAPIYLATDFSRAAATSIDVLQMLISSVLWVAFMWDVSLSIWLKLLGVLVLLWLPAVLDAGSGSLGRRCLKIQVVTAKGQRLGIVISLWRHFVKYVLNIALPVVWKLIEPRLTGGRYLHDVLASTVVIERDASHSVAAPSTHEMFHEALIAQARNDQGAEQKPHGISRDELRKARHQSTPASRTFDAFKTLLALVLAGSLLWLFAQAGRSLYEESQNPAMVAISDAKRASKPLTKMLEQSYEQRQTLELEWANPAMAALEAEMGKTFNSISAEPRGPVMLQIRTGPMAGKHLILVPEFNLTKKAIKKWKCGSPDIERELLPTGCKAQLDRLVSQK
ncbi:MAG: RDD family protein [Gammaproteobacteria bacterium]|nr:RDD family protein [Gammaproteobacteria bacterium]MBU1505908.1 RDD family protein [Gammaproteobacteria bacterium]MBU2123538.1 RDD family protein [Gammaproteobacteria bacterium]MBU2172498.1 RDD family protein [Gammaproteobacteria bacterium]MBU2201956.1 RDD family protein [Gammaproteobacteria bacterium]